MPAQDSSSPSLREGPWTVLDGSRALLTSTYSIGPGNSTTALVAGFGDDELLVVSPGPDPDEATLAALEARGRVTAILAPNGFHRAGLASWAAAFPDATVHAGSGAVARVRDKVPTAADLSSLAARLGSELSLLELPDMRSGEVWLGWGGAEPALYCGDAFANLRATGAISLAFLRAFGFGPGLVRNPWQRRLMALDRPGYDRWLRDTIERIEPALFIPAHGAAIRTPEVAAQLAALLA